LCVDVSSGLQEEPNGVRVKFHDGEDPQLRRSDNVDVA